jgi:hypothetical protein
MLSEGKSYEELIECGLMIEEHEILSLFLSLKRTDARSVSNS